MILLILPLHPFTLDRLVNPDTISKYLFYYAPIGLRHTYSLPPLYLRDPVTEESLTDPPTSYLFFLIYVKDRKY